jgi:citrate synthase
MPLETHPMILFSLGILAMQRESIFTDQYTAGHLKRDDFWEYYLEDSLSLTAKLPVLAAYIYNRKYRNGQVIPPNPALDWSANFAHMIGKGDDLAYQDLCRLFFLIHSDHEGGNVSAHAAHLVASALSDVYLACSAGMNGLAGPLHGLANQECFRWLQGVYRHFGESVPDRSDLETYLRDYLAAGKIIPGYGHAVLRITDPRFTAQQEYASQVMPEDGLFQLVNRVYEVLPPILIEGGKVKNPWPNVDAINGTLQHHFGIRESDFYTVLFGISRNLGITAHCTWARVLNKPIERPKSLTTQALEDMVLAAREGRSYEIPKE